MDSLDNKVVIVTGASSGIGKATAHAFAARGCRVVLVARRVDVLAEAENELAPYGKHTLAIPTDITQEDDIQTLYKTVMQVFGRIDVLVNNAGVSMGGALTQLDHEKMRKMVELNVYAPMRLTQVALPIMLEQKQGHIVNVSSVGGLVPWPGQTAYAATRSALITFSHALRREVAGTGVQVSIILPGWTRTPMIENLSLAELRSAGILMPQMTVDEPKIPAQAIVDAVQHNRRQVILGGPPYLWANMADRLSPWLLDMYCQWFVNKEDITRVIQGLGTGSKRG